MTDGALRTPPPARIDWSGPTPRSLDDGDLYFQADGLDESRHVFINGVQCAAVRVYPGREDSTGVSLRAIGGDANLVHLNTWQMENIYEE